MLRKVKQLKRKVSERLHKPKPKENVFYQLPQEAALHVLSFLAPPDLARVAPVSTYLNALSNDNSLWARFFKPDELKKDETNYKASYRQCLEKREHLLKNLEKIAAFPLSDDAYNVNPFFVNRGGQFEDGMCYDDPLMAGGYDSYITFAEDNEGQFNCIIEFCEEQFFYALRLYLKQDKQGNLYLAAHYLSMEEIVVCREALNPRLCFGSRFNGSGKQFADHLETLAKSESVILLSEQTPEAWARKFLLDAIPELKRNADLTFRPLLSRFHEKKEEQRANQSAESTPKKSCFMR